VLAVDIDETRIRRARENGASAGICTTGLAEREARQAIREEAERAGWDREGWKIFEMSGTPGGQQIGFSLLNYTGVLGVVGFTREKITIRLSNLMAFDADAFGSWACSPRHYPRVLEWIRKGSIRVQPFVTFRPLGEVNQVLDRAHRGEFPERAVLVPEE
jgi:6-hydroxycyclohex-1-ene-1-carbonyl-CoA dehydrogenase